MKLTKEAIRISKENQTPLLIVDLAIVRENYKKIKKSINDVEVFYAMKANDHPKILEFLAKEGSSFEITSLTELKALLRLGVPASKIICLNPVKSPEFLMELAKRKIEIIAFDSKVEVDKIAKYAPKSKLVLRISVSNEGSDWPLTKKFGIDAADAIDFIEYARKKGLSTIGLTFHVGSQCLNKNNWASALYVCNDIWTQAKLKGINFSFLSLGGGIPIHHSKNIPSIKEIGDVINRVLVRNFKSYEGKARITIEPGRGLIGDAAIMATKVIGMAKRGNEDWIYIDAGVFNGFMETIADFKYEIKTEKKRRIKISTIAGPSCDSVDIPFKNVQVGEVKVGENIYILNAGAYTTVYASNFNGFDIPRFKFINA